jgi:hypothetical protein
MGFLCRSTGFLHRGFLLSGFSPHTVYRMPAINWLNKYYPTPLHTKHRPLFQNLTKGKFFPPLGIWAVVLVELRESNFARYSLFLCTLLISFVGNTLLLLSLLQRKLVP